MNLSTWKDQNTAQLRAAAGDCPVCKNHTAHLARCFKAAGADCDGNEDWRIAPRALQAVESLRKDYDATCDEAHALRAVIAEARAFALGPAGNRKLMQVAQPFRQLLNILKQAL